MASHCVGRPELRWGASGVALLVLWSVVTALPAPAAEPQDATAAQELAGAQAPAFNRPLVFGCGMMWATWVSRPWSYDGDCMDRIVAMGGTRTSASFDWVDLEPQPGVWDWTYRDHQVAEAQARGLVQIGYVGNTAIWALPPGVPAEHSYRHPPDESKVAEFQNYCRTVAARYRGKVERFVFWNEPNGCSWVNDGCSNSNGYPLYTRWLKRAYTALKEGNPDCIVGAGVLDYNEGVSEGWRYIDGMYNEGAKGYFDAISIHPYANDGVHWRAIHDTRQVMVDHGDGHLPVWIDEYGWASSGGTDAANKLTAFLTQIVQPQYDYVETCNYLVISDLPGTDYYGLCDRNLNRRPIWYAFRDFPKNLSTSTPTPTGPTPTPTQTLTPTVTHTPTATWTPDPDGNLLGNGDFEAPFVPAPPEQQEDPDYPRMWAPGWTQVGSNWWTNSGPEGNVAHSGNQSQAVGTNWGWLDNTIYQQAPVVPGVRYRYSVWTRADTPADTGDFVWRRAAVDPTGGTSPAGNSVVAGPYHNDDSTWQLTEIEFVADADTATVFASAGTITMNGWQWFYVDNARLAEIRDATGTSLQLH